MGGWSARTCYRVPLGRRVIVINEAKMVCVRARARACVYRNGLVPSENSYLPVSGAQTSAVMARYYAIRREYRVRAKQAGPASYVEETNERGFR